MKIGFDAKRAFTNHSGLGNYARSLIRSLSIFAPEDSYHLYTPREYADPFSAQIQTAGNIHIHKPDSLIDRRLKARWRSYVITRLLQKDGIQLYHGLSNELPFNIQRFRGKKVVTVHDLIFIRHPELYPFLDRTIYNKKCRHACHVADVVVAVSEQTKHDLGELYFLPESRIKVIYQSGDPAFHAPVQKEKVQEVKQRYKLPEEYLLHVGTIEPRKNLIRVLEALSQVPGIPLVVVGKKKSAYKKVSELIHERGLGNRILFLEDVAQDDLPAVYSQAMLFIYPSLIEGFGIPIIEALCCGVPVITSKGGCFAEAGGPGTVYVDPLSTEALREAILDVLGSSQKRNAMREAGLEYAGKFRPESAARQMHKLYHSL